jgi:transposase
MGLMAAFFLCIIARRSNTTIADEEDNMLPTTFAKGDKRTLANLTAMRKEAQTDKAPRVALRIQGVMLSLEKHSVADISRLLHVHRSTAHEWVLSWNAYGKEGLYEGHRSGRPSSLTIDDKVRLIDIVDSGPVAYGLRTGVWSSRILAKIIEDEFGVYYHPGHVRKLLKEIGFSVQRPTTKLVQADPAKQHKWTRYTYPNLKKKPAPKGR